MNKKVSDMTPEEVELQRKYFREWSSNKKLKLTDEELKLAKEKKREYDKQYRSKNKQKIKKVKKDYYEENKENICSKAKEWVKENREIVREKRRELYWKDQEGNIKKSQEYYAQNRDVSLARRKKSQIILREEMFSIIGNKCCECGELNKSFLTLDHKNGGGRADREERGGPIGIIKRLKALGWPKDYIEESYQILCYNHNCGKRRFYLIDLPENLNYYQKKAKRLWQEAFDFFGPCEMCGITDLRFLTIDHINGGGAKIRLNGGQFGVGLIKEFKKMGWPESLKENYRFLCYNHNCAKPE